MFPLRALPKLCVAVGAKDPDRAYELVTASVGRRENFFELRLDMLENPADGPALVERVQRSHDSLLVMATCRRVEAQGEFSGSIAEQRVILESAASRGAQIVDVEIESAEQDLSLVEFLRTRARVVLSFHDFKKTPQLQPVLERLQRFKADIYKIATAAHTPGDNARLLGCLSGFPDPLVVLGMGEFGAASRILGPSRGAAFTFASPDGATGTAPGQFDASQMRNGFQVHKRKASTKVYGVIADPVAHSLSPALHNRAFRRRRLDACYVPFRVPAKQLAEFFEFAKDLRIQGLSVTIPHKQSVMAHLDSVDPLAAEIGAVNTVYRKGQELVGANTDAAGVVEPLGARMALAKSRVLVVGYGGAARAAVFALKDKGAVVTVTGRDEKKASSLAADAGVEQVAFGDWGPNSYKALVHTTPVGMSPDLEGNLFPEEIPADIVFDMVYNPLETALLRHARQQGKETIEGIEMFVEQAAAQFELWSGQSAPRVTMRNAVLEVLTGVSPV